MSVPTILYFPGWQQGHMNRVGNQDDFIDSLYGDNHFDHVRGQVEAITNNAGAQGLISELRPHRSIMPMHQIRVAVSQDAY